MDIYQLEQELSNIGLDFPIYHIGKLAYHSKPFIVEKDEEYRWNLNSGLYLYLSLMNKSDELKNEIFNDEKYKPSYHIQIERTSNGLEFTGYGLEFIKKERGEEFSKYIEEQFQKFRLRLLFLFPKVEEII